MIEYQKETQNQKAQHNSKKHIGAASTKRINFEGGFVGVLGGG